MKDFVGTLRNRIEKHSSQLAIHNPLLRNARLGLVTTDQIAVYLYNLMHVFKTTTRNLGRAAERAEETGQTELARFMADKIPEEAGHDQWAKQDLKRHGQGDDWIDSQKMLPATRELLAFVESLIEKDPALFLSYMVFVEYFTILVAPEFLSNLETRCGIPRDAMSAIANHESADKEHTQEDFDIIARLIHAPEQQESLLEALDASAKRIDAFLTECISGFKGTTACSTPQTQRSAT